jgi:hypothetical protein
VKFPKHGFEATAEWKLELPPCEAIVPVVYEKNAAPFEEDAPCGSMSTLFYLIDGEPLCRCSSHPLGIGEYDSQLRITWDEYRVALVMQS